ncbi:MAG: hypothetical protein ABFR65_12190, partial [Pseudomonadota bacterium]
MRIIYHLPRIFISLLAGAAISGALLWTMQWMLLHKTVDLQVDRERPVMEFVRLKRDSETRVRERPKPDP